VRTHLLPTNDAVPPIVTACDVTALSLARVLPRNSAPPCVPEPALALPLKLVVPVNASDAPDATADAVRPVNEQFCGGVWFVQGSVVTTTEPVGWPLPAAAT
jgi:hypothetical protein